MIAMETMMMNRFSALALLIAASPAAAAAPYQDTVALDRAVATFTTRAIGEDGGARSAVDARLRLAQCGTLALSWRTAQHDAVVVSCTGPEWRVFVPIQPVAGASAAVAPTRATAAPIRPVVVIKRGDPVTIEAGANGFSITREGVALGDAPAGSRFMVKVDDSRNPVQAVALESGRATLPGWND